MKKIFILGLILILFFSFASVSASDLNDTDIVSKDYYQLNDINEHCDTDNNAIFIEEQYCENCNDDSFDNSIQQIFLKKN